jgi:hypothetical protein
VKGTMLLLSQVSLMRQDIQDLIIFAFPEETQKALSLFEGIFTDAAGHSRSNNFCLS